MKKYNYADIMAEIDFLKEKRDMAKLESLIKRGEQVLAMMVSNLNTAIENNDSRVEGRSQIDYACDYMKLKESVRRLQNIDNFLY